MATKKIEVLKADEKPKRVVDEVKIAALNAEKDRLTQLITHKSDRYIALRAYEQDMRMIDDQIAQLTTGYTA